MTTVVLADNAYGTLSVGITATDSSISLTAGQGVRFPAIAGSQVLYACLVNSSNVIEEVQITVHGTSSDTATIVRGVGSTTPKAWSAGDRVEARVSKAVLTDLNTYTPAGTGGVAMTLQSKATDILNLKNYGAVGDGVADDTAAWVNFLAQCVAQNKRGYIPSGVYLMDKFSFTSAHAGLVLFGDTYGRTGTRQGVPPQAGVFGLSPTLFRLRTAQSTFVSIDGCYDLTIDNVSLDGNGFADTVLYEPGTNNNTHTNWNNSFFMRPTPTTGRVHWYDGTNGGEGCKFYNCYLNGDNFPTNGSVAKNCVYIGNSNAFLGRYDHCVFNAATDLVEFSTGSADLDTCEFYGAVSSCIKVTNTCQACTITNPYSEGTNNVNFFLQSGTAGVTGNRTILLINPQVNATGMTIQLNCQQPVHIIDGFLGSTNIDVTPFATYGVMHNIIVGVEFNTGFGITGSGATTQTLSFGCGVLAAGVFTETISNWPTGLVVQGMTVGNGASAVATNTAYGQNALSAITTGASNTGVGGGAGSAITTGNHNTVFGSFSLDQGTVTGSENFAAGRLVMRPLTSGANNCVSGNLAGTAMTTGSNNTLYGYNAGANLTTGGDNTIIGKDSAASANNVTFEIVLGDGLTGKGTQTAFIGGTNGVYNALNASTWTTSSDARVKSIIGDSEKGLAHILRVNVKNFTYLPQNEIPVNEHGEPIATDLDSSKVMTGAIAQEIRDPFPECVNESPTSLLTVNVDPIIWALVKSVQQLSAQFEEYKSTHP